MDAKDHGPWMLRGAQLHAAGQLEQALAAFEQALALNPQDVNAASACATLLSLLDRPMAAYRTLLSVESQLMQDADGAANLAIMAEACGDLARTDSAYARALQLDPGHLRSLNNVGILAAGSSRWDIAIGLAQKCVALQPGHAPYHANLAEYLSGARRYAEALDVVIAATAKFPLDNELRIRHAVLLAFHGELEKADAALAGLDAPTRLLFEKFLLKLDTPGDLCGRASSQAHRLMLQPPDALQIHVDQAFRGLSAGDWRNNDQLTALLRKALADSTANGRGRNWGDAPFYGLLLDLQDHELAQMHSESIPVLNARLKASLPAFTRQRKPIAGQDNRIRVGLAVRSLHDSRQLQALTQQLARHDASRFAIHVYAFTPPGPQPAEALRPHAASVSEIGHMAAAEAAGRMRLDQLDIYVEMASDSSWSRQDIAAMRVAPVQLRQTGLYRRHVPGHWDYSLSDRFAHPDDAGLSQDGAIVRLPHSCWLASAGQQPSEASGSAISREDAGLPTDTLVLASSLAPASIDPRSFSVWMKILRGLPDAVLWLPRCGAAAINLAREAQAAGVGPTRLLFSTSMDRSDALAAMRHADLFLDTLRLNAVQGLEDALHLGVPAISCAGSRPASRLGGSILHAAGLAQCVLDSPEAYSAEAVRLGRNPGALQDLRKHVEAAAAGRAPLFDLAARIREWESAWATMAERSRAGLPPAAFNVAAV
ncbi:tetratricopeptide repeat protein [Polaromonas sp. CT11-55]|uniref:O-linked N-acetylglucosamine transferase family protein n=1 Tax=Polaromonas sp. CT11-55 TaxID=3243045 RepID=UPI0039A74EBB